MKKIAMIVIVSFFLALHFGLAHSVEGFSQINNSNTQTQGQSDTEKSAILQSQIELMRQYEDRILQTVYWSLGGMITVVVLIAGFGWFANFRLYEHDKKVLRQELLQLLTHEMEKIHKELDDTARRAVSREVMEFKTMKYDMLRAKAQKYKDEGVFPNVILIALEMLKVARDLDWNPE